MRRARQRGFGVAGQLAWCTAVMGAFTMAGELVVTRLGLWAYNGANTITLFKGRYYQFPLSEALLFGLLGTGFTAIRYFRNDKGETLAERGIERVGGSNRRRIALRILATAGLANVAFLVLWQLPTMHLATVSGRWPEEIVERPWLTNNLCGPHTSYACPGPDIPLNRKHSMHIGPNGEL